MRTAHAERPYYPALDGLRGLAILLVVVYHNFGFINYFFFGWLGVDLFFVLSGFLITDILLKTVGRSGYLRNFYWRRILRIFPLYYVCLAIFLFVIPAFKLLPDINYYVQHQAWLWTYLQNWLYIFKGDDSVKSLHHLWSLAVEEQFYLVWPLIILIIRKPRILLAFIVLVLLGVIVLRLWVWNHDVESLSYYKLYTFTRIDGLCIGCMVALLHRINKDFIRSYTFIIVLFFALLNFGFYFVNKSSSFSFPYLALVGYSTFAMLFGLIVHQVVTRDSRIINGIFSMQPLRFFGRISYGLYVIHWPLYLILQPILTNQLQKVYSGAQFELIISFVSTMLAILLSWLSFKYFESRFLQMKNKFS